MFFIRPFRFERKSQKKLIDDIVALVYVPYWFINSAFLKLTIIGYIGNQSVQYCDNMIEKDDRPDQGYYRSNVVCEI